MQRRIRRSLERHQVTDTAMELETAEPVESARSGQPAPMSDGQLLTMPAEPARSEGGCNSLARGLLRQLPCGAWRLPRKVRSLIAAAVRSTLRSAGAVAASVKAAAGPQRSAYWVTCPNGRVAESWYPRVSSHGIPVLRVRFPAASCRACPDVITCAPSKAGRGREIMLRERAAHEAMQRNRAAQRDPGWWNL